MWDNLEAHLQPLRTTHTNFGDSSCFKTPTNALSKFDSWFHLPFILIGLAWKISGPPQLGCMGPKKTHFKITVSRLQMAWNIYFFQHTVKFKLTTGDSTYHSSLWWKIWNILIEMWDNLETHQQPLRTTHTMFGDSSSFQMPTNAPSRFDSRFQLPFILMGKNMEVAHRGVGPLGGPSAAPKGDTHKVWGF